MPWFPKDVPVMLTSPPEPAFSSVLFKPTPAAVPAVAVPLTVMAEPNEVVMLAPFENCTPAPAPVFLLVPEMVTAPLVLMVLLSSTPRLLALAAVLPW